VIGGKLPAGVLLAGCILLSGCSTTIIRRKVEKKAERRLPSVLGPAERYKVRILETQDAELVRGRARRIEIEGKKIHGRGQMLVDSMHLTVRDLRYTGKKPYVVSVGRTELRIEFTDMALNDYLTRYQARYAPSVRFETERVHVRMLYGFLGKPAPISGFGRFEIENGTRLMFKAEKVDLSLINQPGFGEKFVEDRVNPLLDMKEIDFPARIESVTILPGRIRVHGSATIPADLKADSDS
jgi:hypothetical protein